MPVVAVEAVDQMRFAQAREEHKHALVKQVTRWKVLHVYKVCNTIFYS